MGEPTSDYMVHHFNPYVAVVLGTIILVMALVLQFSVRTYIAGVYWLTALAVSIAGTMGADVAHVGLGVPYIVSAALYAVILGVVFIGWQRAEGTLSIHSVSTPRRESFYWAAVLTTFALGTATGDLTAYSLNLGYFTSGVIFGVLFALPGVAYRLFKLNPIAAFWVSYIMTRPLGASFADWAAKPSSFGGLGLGDGLVSGALGVLLVVFVGYLGLTHKDLQTRTKLHPLPE